VCAFLDCAAEVASSLRSRFEVREAGMMLCTAENTGSKNFFWEDQFIDFDFLANFAQHGEG
jgi:hypothetical protein